MTSVRLIENLHIFNEFSHKELELVAGLCSTAEYREEECLFKEGDPATEMWIVLDGGVELRFELPGRRASTSESMVSSHQNDVPESQVFGWSCFIPPYKMRLSAYCTSKRCHVLKIGSDQLYKVMNDDKEIGFKIMNYLVQVIGFRFKQMQNEVAKIMGVSMMNSW